MSGSYIIKAATRSDFESVSTLLSQQKLPVEDITEDLSHFFVVKQDDMPVAVIGMEHHGEIGLLRSMATDPAYRNHGFASSLVNSILNHGRTLGLKEMYLLTETAETYFAKRGFRKINREEAPAAIKQSAEFTHLCPSSAVVMKKEL